MKIEIVNNNQIRCTLTKDDLAKRHIRLSELAYGTDKAKLLFRDLMQQASTQFGFKADNTPLMIEAIPISAGSIVLVVTKVDDPEELDTRFSNFSPAVQQESGGDDSSSSVFDRILEAIRQSGGSGDGNDITDESASPYENEEAAKELDKLKKYLLLHRLFVFDSLGSAIDASVIAKTPDGVHCALYRNDSTGKYYLSLVFQDEDTVGKAQNILAVLSEYSAPELMSYAREQNLKEHCITVINENALDELAKLM
ncbi:MAG: adaptor protein MecA [Lachnospiraceae bacterium]|nr:adaptor protein MecA [Lachnospiraceae bacterium]